jgi:parallel beta-helix repeat protein
MNRQFCFSGGFQRFLILVTFLLLTGCGRDSAHTYYVDCKKGSDSNSGRSASNAFRTIRKASEVISPGEVCIVKKGNYPERVYIHTSGTKENPITFKASGKGVVTKGFTVEADFVRIEGFEITSTSPKGWKEGAGIHLKGRGCRLTNNYIHDVFLEGIRLGDDLTSASTSNCLVSGNRMIRCGQAGIQICGQNNRVENNEISGTVQCSKTTPPRHRRTRPNPRSRPW